MSDSGRQPFRGRGRGAQPEAKGRGATEDEPADASVEAMEKLARELERRVERQEPLTRPDQASLAHARQEQARVQEALARQEAELRERPGELTRELPGGEKESRGWLERLRRRIAKTRDSLAQGLGRLAGGGSLGETDLLAGLEDVLLAADVGPQTTARLLAVVKERLRRKELDDPGRLQAVVREEILRIMSRPYPAAHLDTLAASERPGVVLFVGVNGSGKTTSIGKLAAQYRRAGKKVLLAAGDTFRAAAAEQLLEWGGRSGCEVFAKPAGSDPSGVLYQALQQAITAHCDLVLCDTAGRLHTKANLMEELKKLKRVLGKLIPAAPQETWLVLDGNTGQNAIRQTREFHEALGLTGLIVTKLDGTARGGMIVGIVNEFDLPIRYIGIGEGVEDLRPFDARQFAESLFEASA